MVKKKDIAIFGATGFTGVRVARYAVAQEVKHHRGHTILLCGRRVDALNRERDALIAQYPTVGVSKFVSVQFADSGDADSLQQMCTQARVVVACAGPYRFLGAAVVKAAAEAGCDYVDVCGEPEFMSRVLLEHDGAAKESGACIVTACGFDSVPADLGVHCRWCDCSYDASALVTVISILCTLRTQISPSICN
jgi:short subunit dehydrogenase-like uncharacterized protein